jgi:hypothetical protein
MKHVFGIITASMILLMTGCVTDHQVSKVSPVSMASMDQDTKAKEFSPLSNKASLYIYRSESLSSRLLMTVSVNGKDLGQTMAQTYFWLNVKPGKYNIESYAENISLLSLSVEAGKTYFVWQEVKFTPFSLQVGGGMPSRSLLQLVDGETGRIGVMDSQLIVSMVSDNDLTPLEAPITTPATSPAR